MNDKNQETPVSKENKVEEVKEVNTKPEPSYLIPGSIVMAGLIIAMAVFANNGGSGNMPTILDSRVATIAQASGLDPVELQECSSAGEYEEDVASDIANAIATGGQGTPWTVILDTQTNSYYPLNGALPIEQVIELLDTNFASLELTEEQQTQLAAANPVTEEDYYRGPEDARYVFIEYSDFDCPFCARFHETMKTLTTTRTDVGWVYRHFPLEQLHPDAKFVANVIECAGEGGDNEEAFWQAADSYFR